MIFSYFYANVHFFKLRAGPMLQRQMIEQKFIERQLIKPQLI